MENLNALFSQSGQMLQADVKGQIDINCRLSGMPDCQIQLNDRQLNATKDATLNQNQVAAVSSVGLDDVWFHNCVKLSSF